jgi:hypothetical protein
MQVFIFKAESRTTSLFEISGCKIELVTLNLGLKVTSMDDGIGVTFPSHSAFISSLIFQRFRDYSCLNIFIQ